MACAGKGKGRREGYRRDRERHTRERERHRRERGA